MLALSPVAGLLRQQKQVPKQRTSFGAKVSVGFHPVTAGIHWTKLRKSGHVIGMQLAAVDEYACAPQRTVRRHRTSQFQAGWQRAGRGSLPESGCAAAIVVPVGIVRQAKPVDALHLFEACFLLLGQFPAVKHELAFGLRLALGRRCGRLSLAASHQGRETEGGNEKAWRGRFIFH